MLLRDSRGRASWTVTLAVPAIALLVLRYVGGGVEVVVGSVKVAVGALEGLGAAAVLAVFWGAFQTREWVEKTKAGG